MAEATKACSLTEGEIEVLIANHGSKLVYPHDKLDERIERINYLNKRLKAFKEPEPETKPTLADIKPATGWGTPTKE